MLITFETDMTLDGIIQLPQKFRNLAPRRVSVTITDALIDAKRNQKKAEIMKYAGLWSDLTDEDAAEMFSRTQLVKVDGVIIDEKTDS